MLIGADQQMSAGVREQIQNDEIVLRAIEDKTTHILVGRGANTKGAPVSVVDAGDVLISPRRP
jgi:hypothetical protein